MPYRLSKTRFLAGLQCHKYLWWREKDPRAPELKADPATQLLFDQGRAVGERACEEFPGGFLVDLPHWQDVARVRATRDAMLSGAPAVYEATFVEDGVFVAVDILARGDSGGWRLIEVKSSLSLKDVHLPDAAVQAWVLGRAGIPVEAVEVMHLNRDCVYPHLGNLFVREDVAEQVRDWLPRVPSLVAAQKEVLDGPLPSIEVGPQCKSPYECPFLARCWPEPTQHGLHTLYYGGKKRDQLSGMGVETLAEIPYGFPLSAIQERQRRAVRSGEVTVEGDLARTLDGIFGPGPGRGGRVARHAPIAFLDFETVSPFIPRWDGCSPMTQLPVQFSCHLVDADGSLSHTEWIASGPEDPRPECAERLVELLADVPVIVAYNAGFEKRCLELLARALGDSGDVGQGIAASLLEIADRLADLLPVVRNHVYHPDFNGSFGLKAVLPALVPDLSYDDLEIAGGQVASVELFNLMFRGDGMAEGEGETLRARLLAYCKLDTLALVRLKEVLEGWVPRI